MTSRTDPQDLEPPPAAGVIECVEALRRALSAADVERAQSLRWLAPRPPGERDLLSDMAAAEGLEPAIRQLSKFWGRARVRLEQVRSIDECEAEVYERLTLANGSLPIVTLVRRERTSDPWRVVCTQEAQGERFVIWVAVHAHEIDDVAVSLALPVDNGGQLLVDDGIGVLGHDEHGWLTNVRGPFVPDEWPEALPGEDGRVVELATALSPQSDDRRAQLAWLLKTAKVFAETLGGAAAYMVREQRVLTLGAIDAAVSEAATPSQAMRFWARVETEGGHVYTNGLRLLGLPEVEMRTDIFDDPTFSRDLVSWLAEVHVGTRELLAPGTELVIGDGSLVLRVGRRGPRRGTSYGRWGAVQLAEIAGRLLGSRSRMRVPDDLLRRRP